MDAIQQLRARFPDTPFLTLGQTVLWDEPVKAAFCRILEAVAPDAQIVAAVHDTDYFAKLATSDATDDEQAEAQNLVPKFALMGHNDGATRGLWSAAGELSCLFGAEIVPSRASLAESGVAFDRVARDYPGGADALLNRETEAWGWRALVHTEPHPLIAADVKLRDIGAALREQLQWGFRQSLDIVGESTPESARVAQQVEGWIDEYSANNLDGTLSDLYQALTPRLWNLVRGGGNCNVQSGASMQMFRFNRETAKRGRFHFVDLFLRRETREIARRCYDDAVRGSGIYTLNQFGEGALPFDVVIPGRGRGTLRLDEGSLYIETEEPITLCTGCDCASVQELAASLEDRFGPDVALVGKAVALISMLSSEFIFVFHEKASGYTSRTQVMNECLRAEGIELPLHPMLRLKYATWNALGEVETSFDLPPHLARAFGNQHVSATEFAARWETVCQEQDDLRARLKACPSPRDLMTFLAQRINGDSSQAASHSDNGRDWESALHEYSEARAVIRALRDRTQVLEHEIDVLRQSAREATQRAAEIERAKGRDWRAVVQPLRMRLFDLKEAAAERLMQSATSDGAAKLSREEKREKARLEAERDELEEREIADLRARIAACIEERAHFDRAIAEQRSQAHHASSQARARIKERIALEKSDESRAARTTIARLQYQAELERLGLTRDAILVSQGLRLTNYRPTAWWFPLVSPDGRWFKQLAKTAQGRIEEL